MTGVLCAAIGCDELVHARQLCYRHYHGLLRNGGARQTARLALPRQRKPVERSHRKVITEPEPNDLGWQERGACVGVNPDLFFPDRGASTREAKAVCATCPVREICLEYSLVNHEKFGVWGGLSERQRRRLVRRRATGAA